MTRMLKPEGPPDLHEPHVAVSLHLKVFDAHPDWVWHNEKQHWLPRNSVDAKVEVYADRVRGWFLRWGRDLQQLPDGHDAGFVVLMIAISYLEGNEQYRRGDSSRNRSEAFFKAALRRIFDIEDADARTVYTAARCGLFHDGMTKGPVLIENRFEKALVVENGKVLISPNKFLAAVVASFEDYIQELQDPSNKETREKFERFFDQAHGR